MKKLRQIVDTRVPARSTKKVHLVPGKNNYGKKIKEVKNSYIGKTQAAINHIRSLPAHKREQMADHYLDKFHREKHKVHEIRFLKAAGVEEGMNESREKTEHEPLIRQVATERRSYFYKNVHDRNPNRLAHYGDCGHVSRLVCDELKKHYPSAKVVDGSYVEHYRTGPHKWMGTTGHYIDHTWVEIPEIKHFVDPTHDQMPQYSKTRKTMLKSKSGLFADNAIKIGKTNGNHYKTHYAVDEE